jgi:hypothetical protein
MIITLKPHSTFSKFFNEKDYKIEITSYYDIEFYLASVHPRFSKYMSQIKQGFSVESFCYVTQDLTLIKRDEINLKKPKEGMIVYIAPVVSGSGGRRGAMFAVAAFAVVGVATGGFSMLGAPGAAGGAGTGGLLELGTAGFQEGMFASGGIGNFFGGVANAFAGMPSFVQSIIGNLALSLITSLFTSRPKGRSVEVAKDSGTRNENNIFGSLQNTTEPGTPIALNYGLMRVGGQFLSGYILSQQHAQNDAPSIAQMFNSNESPLAAEARAEE